MTKIPYDLLLDKSKLNLAEIQARMRAVEGGYLFFRKDDCKVQLPPGTNESVVFSERLVGMRNLMVDLAKPLVMKIFLDGARKLNPYKHGFHNR